MHYNVPNVPYIFPQFSSKSNLNHTLVTWTHAHTILRASPSVGWKWPTLIIQTQHWCHVVLYYFSSNPFNYPFIYPTASNIPPPSETNKTIPSQSLLAIKLLEPNLHMTLIELYVYWICKGIGTLPQQCCYVQNLPLLWRANTVHRPLLHLRRSFDILRLLFAHRIKGDEMEWRNFGSYITG